MRISNQSLSHPRQNFRSAAAVNFLEEKNARKALIELSRVPPLRTGNR